MGLWGFLYGRRNDDPGQGRPGRRGRGSRRTDAVRPLPRIRAAVCRWIAAHDLARAGVTCRVGLGWTDFGIDLTLFPVDGGGRIAGEGRMVYLPAAYEALPVLVCEHRVGRLMDRALAEACRSRRGQP